jgi:hypothetical protein
MMRKWPSSSSPVKRPATAKKSSGSRQLQTLLEPLVTLPSGHVYRVIDKRKIDGVAFLRLEAAEVGHKPRKLIVPLSQAMRLFFPKTKAK